MSPGGTASRVQPLLRLGRWYESRDTAPVPGMHRRGPALGLAPAILVRSDARRLRPLLASRPAPSPADRLTMVRRAVDRFCEGTVEVPGWGPQSAAEFRSAMADVAGLPEALVRRWAGLLRATVPTVPPEGGEDRRLSLVSLPANTFTCLEAVLSEALSGAAVWVRPSRREPLSAARLVAALLQAGWPAERLGLYPTPPEALPHLIEATDRQVVFGGHGLAGTVDRAAGLDLRGPGTACAVVDAAALEAPHAAAEWLAELIASDGGRFCVNVCSVVVLGPAGALLRHLAALLDGIRLHPADPRRPLARSDAGDAARITALIDAGLAAGGARRLTRRRSAAPVDGGSVLPPTLVEVSAIDHPLFGCELPFPFAAAVRTDAEGMRRATRRAGFVFPHPATDHDRKGTADHG